VVDPQRDVEAWRWNILGEALSDPIGLNGGGSTYGYLQADSAASSDAYSLRCLRSTSVPNLGPAGRYEYHLVRYYSNGYRYSASGGSDLDAFAGAVGLTFQLSRPREWADPNGFNRSLLGGLLSSAFGSTQESRGRKRSSIPEAGQSRRGL
jgi:hypothetical protein